MTKFQCIDCERIWTAPRPESCSCGGDFMREIVPEEGDVHDALVAEDAVMREAAYVVRRAEMEEYMGPDAKPWEETEDEPVTMGDFRRFPPGSDERELIMAKLLLDIWNELDHIRHHVCPASDDDGVEDIDGDDDPDADYTD